jgi:hypothetical protein
MLKFAQKRRGQKAAIETLMPLVESSRERLGDIPDGVWLSPYLVGLLGMLITLTAQREAGPLPTEVMGRLQAAAWADITGVPSDLIGEEICYLSATENKAFALGCRNALALFAVVSGNASIGDSPLDWPLSTPEVDTIALFGHVPALWQVFFDGYLRESCSGLFEPRAEL